MGRKVALPGDAVTEQEAGHTEAEVTTSVPGAGLETGGCMTRVTLSTVYCRAAARNPGPHRGPGGYQQLDGEGGPGPGLPRAAAEHLRHLTVIIH